MKHILTLCMLALAGISIAQKNNTKAEYFQQEVNYSIDVKLDDHLHTLSGFEQIQYINHSPHPITDIYFHLWPNAYRSKETALAKQLLENGETDMYFANPQMNYGYIDSLQFIVNKDTVRWEYDTTHMDIAIVHLKKVLNPGDTAFISTPFFVKLPSSYSRLGHVDQSYQITQWYPKPAVYDRDGWHPMPYLDQGEFYSEFGSFDVRISVPKNYVVAATGDLFDCPEEEKWLELRAKNTKALLEENRIDKLGNIRGEYDMEFPESEKQFKTLRYKQNNVHDFAWFADKRFYVLRGEYNLPKSGRNVTLWSFFTKDNSRYWAKSTQYLHDAVKYYSMWNGEYPYNVVSAVDGTISAGGGMEYPTVTVIGESNSDIGLETVIMHEVGHNWFYGILGSNERDHPWMDEGLNSFNEMRYIETKYPELSLLASFAPQLSSKNEFFDLKETKQRAQYYISYVMNARRNLDQPIEEKSENYTPTNYGGIVYSKTALAFAYLKAYLGEKTFDKCMHAYYEKWKFKHPSPDDMKEVFQETAKKDLSWFFDGVIKENQVIDYKFKRKKRVDRRSSKTYTWMKYEESLVVVNKGTADVPFCINGVKGDTLFNTVWYPGHKGKATINFPNGPYDYFKIDFDERIPEVDRKNNMMKEKGLFRRMEPLKFQFITSLENPKKSVIYWSPVIGMNAYDGFMAGFLLYNNLFPQRNFEWQLMPMYGFRSKKPIGYGNMEWHINTRKSDLLNSIDVGLNAASFQTERITINDFTRERGFIKIAPHVGFKLKKKKARSVNNHYINLRSVMVYEDTVDRCNGDCNGLLPQDFGGEFVLYNEIQYFYSNTNTLHPWNGKMMVQQNNDFLKLELSAAFKRFYNAKMNFVEARVFAGKFIYNNSTSSRYNFRSDGQHGRNDYTYDEVFPARNATQGMWMNQFVANQGALKIGTANGQSIDWLTAFNLKASLPIPIIHLFADVALSKNPAMDAVFLYDAGISIPMFRGIAEVYLPLVWSSVIKDEYKANGYGYGNAIRFTFNLNNLNPFKQVKNIKG